MEAFWTTIATVVPVIALAVVLELRAYGSRWYDQPLWLRTPQALLWTIFLVAAYVAEGGAINALRRDIARPPPRWLPDLTTFVVTNGIGLLILTPALELLMRLGIPFFAVVHSAQPELTTKLWRLYLRASPIWVINSTTHFLTLKPYWLKLRRQPREGVWQRRSCCRVPLL